MVRFWWRKEKILVDNDFNHERVDFGVNKFFFFLVRRVSHRCSLFFLTCLKMMEWAREAFQFRVDFRFLDIFFWLFEVIYMFIKVYRVSLSVFWVKIVEKIIFLGKKNTSTLISSYHYGWNLRRSSRCVTYFFFHNHYGRTISHPPFTK